MSEPIVFEITVGRNRDCARYSLEAVAEVDPSEFVDTVVAFVRGLVIASRNTAELIPEPIHGPPVPYEMLVDCEDGPPAEDLPPPTRVRKQRGHRPLVRAVASDFDGKCPVCLEPVLSPEGLERHRARRHAA